MSYVIIAVIILVIGNLIGTLVSYFIPPRGKFTKEKADKEEMFSYIFDSIVYKIACVVTLGLVYLIRVIITESISVTFSKRAWARRNKDFLDKLENKLLDK